MNVSDNRSSEDLFEDHLRLRLEGKLKALALLGSLGGGRGCRLDPDFRCLAGFLHGGELHRDAPQVFVQPHGHWPPEAESAISLPDMRIRAPDIEA